jgi:hypothetical protein
MKATIKSLNRIVDVCSVDFENRLVYWFDGQYDREYPPNKLFEMASFDDVVFDEKN